MRLEIHWKYKNKKRNGHCCSCTNDAKIEFGFNFPKSFEHGLLVIKIAPRAYLVINKTRLIILLDKIVTNKFKNNKWTKK